MAIPGERSGTDGVLSNERNWSELPQDILQLFSKKLLDIFDFISFRVVCKSWQLSVRVINPPPQLPWLMEYRQDLNAIIRFYCLSSGNVHTITCPGSRDAWLKGPTCRYLLASHSRSSKMYLLSPLTHDQIHVPSFNLIAIPNYIGLYPIEGSGIVVTPRYTNIMMAFWLPEADRWVYVEGVGGNRSSNAFFMGQYFMNDKDTDITNVIDIATKKLAYQVAPLEDINPLLKGGAVIVESEGKIVRLFEHYEAEPCHFDIHYLYFGDGEGKPCWVEITDIGDQMLFLQYNGGLSFCASNFAGFKGNCIYFMKNNLGQYEQYLCRYDIGDGTTEVLPCPFDFVQTWFVPSL